MVNQQKGVQQDTAYSAVVVNDHMYPRPYIVFDSKVVITKYGSTLYTSKFKILQINKREYRDGKETRLGWS